MATKCTYGPDEQGAFDMDIVVPNGIAERCARESCICTSHDNYHEILAERLVHSTNLPEDYGTDIDNDVVNDDNSTTYPVESATDQAGVEENPSTVDEFEISQNNQNT